MSKIYLRLAGGLGNQLFQLLAAHELHNSTGQQVVVLTNALSEYKTERRPECIKFLTDYHQGVFEFRYSKQHSPLEWLALTARAGRWAPMIAVNDRNFHSLTPDSFERFSHSLVMDGYFQSGWTMESFGKALQSVSFLRSFSKQRNINPLQCVVHIRGGDFLKVKIHQVTDVDYYCFAIRHALREGCAEFIVVSDDPHYSGAVIQQIKARIEGVKISSAHQGDSLVADFSCIAQAPARIIGNSTFSWWAAALGSPQSRTWSPLPFTTRREREFSLPLETLLKPNPDGSWPSTTLA